MQTVLRVDLQLLPALPVVHELVHLRRTEPELPHPYLSSGAPYSARLLPGTLLFPGFTTRCEGWSWSWLVPLRLRLSSRSKVSLRSCLGYSMG